MNSVFPTVSSSKTSKIIIVSTPHGMGNTFYKIYSKASLDLDAATNDPRRKWHHVRVDWWDVPGRDEHWREQQLETMGGDINKFNQEFGNCVCGDTLITVKDKETGEILQIPIGECYKYFCLN